MNRPFPRTDIMLSLIHIWTKKRNDICHTDNYTDKNWIRQIQKQHSKITQNSNNSRIQKFSVYETTKSLVCKTHNAYKHICPFMRQYGCLLYTSSISTMVQQDNFLTYIKNSKYAYYYPSVSYTHLDVYKRQMLEAVQRTSYR